ncbi:MAG: hypothetical protein JXB14_05075 [Candidatus Altiarchaeota archaeon]|nr:hypothetical protein [Candidatus Altiarchaeota archaeon]
MVRIVDETFEALFALTDIRQLWRETKPGYKLTPEQKELLKKKMERVKKALEAIEEETK